MAGVQRRPGQKTTPYTMQAYCEAALKAWGGPQAFGKELKRRYDAGTTNAAAKVRILDMMLEFLKIQHAMMPQDETVLSDLTPAELDAELRMELDRIYGDNTAPEPEGDDELILP
jgi:hypothetical protein